MFLQNTYYCNISDYYLLNTYMPDSVHRTLYGMTHLTLTKLFEVGSTNMPILHIINLPEAQRE